MKKMILRTKKRFILVAILLGGFIVGMTGCLEGDSSPADYRRIPTYVTSGNSYVMLQSVVGTTYCSGGVITASSIGAYGLASFTIDQKNQTTTDYPTANAYEWFPAIDLYASTSGGSMMDSYPDSVGKMTLYWQTLLNKRLFISVLQTAPSDRVYRYELICNSDSTQKYGMTMMYMKAQITTPGTSTTKEAKESLMAFNMAPIMNAYARDTTDAGYKFKYIKMKMNYQTGVNLLGEPIFREIDEPVYIYDVVTEN